MFQKERNGEKIAGNYIYKKLFKKTAEVEDINSVN